MLYVGLPWGYVYIFTSLFLSLSLPHSYITRLTFIILGQLRTCLVWVKRRVVFSHLSHAHLSTSFIHSIMHAICNLFITQSLRLLSSLLFFYLNPCGFQSCTSFSLDMFAIFLSNYALHLTSLKYFSSLHVYRNMAWCFDLIWFDLFCFKNAFHAIFSSYRNFFWMVLHILCILLIWMVTY